MPDVIEEALGKGDKDYQDYDILGDKSGLFTDYMSSLTRPLAPITATIGQLAQGYASTDLPLAERLQDYLEKIARLRNKENLTQPATMDNLTQQDFDIANQRFAEGGRAGYMGGGIAGIRKPSAIPPERGGLRSLYINDKDY